MSDKFSSFVHRNLYQEYYSVYLIKYTTTVYLDSRNNWPSNNGY